MGKAASQIGHVIVKRPELVRMENGADLAHHLHVERLHLGLNLLLHLPAVFQVVGQDLANLRLLAGIEVETPRQVPLQNGGGLFRIALNAEGILLEKDRGAQGPGNAPQGKDQQDANGGLPGAAHELVEVVPTIGRVDIFERGDLVRVVHLRQGPFLPDHQN